MAILTHILANIVCTQSYINLFNGSVMSSLIRDIHLHKTPSQLQKTAAAGRCRADASVREWRRFISHGTLMSVCAKFWAALMPGSVSFHVAVSRSASMQSSAGLVRMSCVRRSSTHIHSPIIVSHYSCGNRSERPSVDAAQHITTMNCAYDDHTSYCVK